MQQNNKNSISKEIRDNLFFMCSMDQLKENTIITQKDCQDFQNSWNDLAMDKYMADGGKYRFRRYSVIICKQSKNNSEINLEFLPTEPHFQKESYNSLNGGVYRHYEPFNVDTLKNPILRMLIERSGEIFNITQTKYDWRVECHQFRIKPTREFCGLPTPEGKHRDGVDFVFMMLVNRENISGGKTGLYNKNGEFITSTTLEKPFECILLDDVEAMHDVSAVHREDNNNEAFRDMLVLTFRKIIPVQNNQAA